MILCWNYLCTCVISNLNDYFFFSIINLTFGTYDTIGILNILLSVINILFIMFFLAFFYYKIMNINRLLFLAKVVLKSLAFGTKIFLKNDSKNVLDRSDCSFLPLHILPQNKMAENLDVRNKQNEGIQKKKESISLYSSFSGSKRIPHNNMPLDTLELKDMEFNSPTTVRRTLFNENEEKFVKIGNLDSKNKKNHKNEVLEILADPLFSRSLKPVQNQVEPSNNLESKDMELNSAIKEKRSIFNDVNKKFVFVENLDAKNKENENLQIFSDTTRRKVVPFEHLDENCTDRNSPIELKTKILQKEPSEKAKESMEKFEILYGDFKQDSKIQSVYFLLDLMKFPILSLSLILDRYHPLRQSIFISSISFFMILFLLAIRPYKSKYLFITNFLSQLCVLICTASALVLAYYDDIGSNDQDKRFFVGNIIVFGAMGFIYLISAIVIGFTLISALRFVKLAILFFRKKMKKNMVIPLKS